MFVKDDDVPDKLALVKSALGPTKYPLTTSQFAGNVGFPGLIVVPSAAYVESYVVVVPETVFLNITVPEITPVKIALDKFVLDRMDPVNVAYDKFELENVVILVKSAFVKSV